MVLNTVVKIEHLGSSYSAPQTGHPALGDCLELKVSEQDAKQSVLFTATSTCLGSRRPVP